MLHELIIYISGRIYSLKTTSNGNFLRNFPWEFYLLPVFLPEIFWKEAAEEIFLFLYFLFWCLTWGLNRGLTSNKPAYYLLDYDNFLWPL